MTDFTSRFFGESLSLGADGEVLIAGAPDTYIRGSLCGLHLFIAKVIQDQVISQVISPPTIKTNDSFGVSAKAISGADMVIIGSPSTVVTTNGRALLYY